MCLQYWLVCRLTSLLAVLLEAWRSLHDFSLSLLAKVLLRFEDAELPSSVSFSSSSEEEEDGEDDEDEPSLELEESVEEDTVALD